VEPNATMVDAPAVTNEKTRGKPNSRGQR
jgi:hypothetical protein